MQAHATTNDEEAELAAEVRRYRDILRRRTRYYLAQRDAGVPRRGTAILDLVILANLESCFMDMEALAEVMDLPRNAVRDRVVELIRGGWIEVRHSQSGAGLYATEKAGTFAESWLGIADAA